MCSGPGAPCAQHKGLIFLGASKMLERCERCGKNLGLVGRVHRCEPAVTEIPVTKNEAVTKIQEIEAEKRRRGRPRKADALTGAQRVARHRAKRRGGG